MANKRIFQNVVLACFEQAIYKRRRGPYDTQSKEMISYKQYIYEKSLILVSLEERVVGY